MYDVSEAPPNQQPEPRGPARVKLPDLNVWLTSKRPDGSFLLLLLKTVAQNHTPTCAHHAHVTGRMPFVWKALLSLDPEG